MKLYRSNGTLFNEQVKLSLNSIDSLTFPPNSHALENHTGTLPISRTDLKIGGRNLFEKSMQNDLNIDNYTYILSASNYTNKIIAFQNSRLKWFEVGTYTISYDIKASGGYEDRVSIRIAKSENSPTVNPTTLFYIRKDVNDEFKRVSHTFTLLVPCYLHLQIYNFQDGISYDYCPYVEVRNIKIEKGNIDTDHSPAPEDMVSKAELVDTEGIVLIDKVPNIPNSKLTQLEGRLDLLSQSIFGYFLDTQNKIYESLIPAVAITDTYEASTQTAMLALSAQKGDICIRNDLNKSFVLTQTPATTLANWKELRTPTDAVLSVAGKTGVVTLNTTDISGISNYTTHDYVATQLNTKVPTTRTIAGVDLQDDITASELRTGLSINNVDNTSDADKPVSTAQQTALNLKANLANAALTGNPTAPTQSLGNSSTRLATTAFSHNLIEDRLGDLKIIDIKSSDYTKPSFIKLENVLYLVLEG